jgi:hypothetical protein
MVAEEFSYFYTLTSRSSASGHGISPGGQNAHRRQPALERLGWACVTLATFPARRSLLFRPHPLLLLMLPFPLLLFD